MRHASILFSLWVLIALTACPAQPAGSGPAAKKGGTTLAKVGPTVITVEEFEEKLNQQSPFIRSRYADVDKRKEYLDNQVRFELLAQEALRRGLDKDPEIQDSLKKIIVQKLTRDEFDNRVKLEDISDAEAEKFYQEHPDEYHKPEMVRVAHIFLPFGSDQAAAKKQADKVAAELRSKKQDHMAFRNLAKQYSADAASKDNGGDLRYMAAAEIEQEYGKAFADAAFALKNLNDQSDVVTGKAGFHILQQTGRRPAIERTLEQVKTQIKNRLYRDKRTEAFNKFVDDLKAKAGVSIDDQKLAAIKIVGTPQSMPAGMMPSPGPLTPPGAQEHAVGGGEPMRPAPPAAPPNK